MKWQPFISRDKGMIFRSARWSDRRLAQYREDPVALTLKCLEPTLLVVWVTSWWLTYPLNEYLIVLPFLALASSLAANWRLQSTIRQIEEDGGESKYISFPERLNNWGIRHYRGKVRKLLALADSAVEHGDNRAATKYRRRATKHQETVDKCQEMGVKFFG